MNAKIFIDFDINEQQPAAAWDDTYQKKMINKDTSTKNSTVISEKVEILTDANKPKKNDVQTNQGSSFPTWAIIAIAAGAVVIVAVVVVVIILVSKKKKTK